MTPLRSSDSSPQATILAIANGRELVADLRVIRESWNDVIAARSDSVAWKLADLLARRPVVNAALLAQELHIESANAHRYLNPLTEVGILAETTSGPRNRAGRRE